MKIELDLPVPEGFQLLESKAIREFDAEGKKKFMVYSELTFERIEQVDEELEQAKKRFSSGWFLWDGRETVYKTEFIERDTKGHGLLMITSDAGNTYLLSDCIPTTLPTWRCCESDKPKVEGTYYVRCKADKVQYLFYYTIPAWRTVSHKCMTQIWPHNYEWLDEGER